MDSEKEINKLLTDYCFMIDTADFEGFSTLFEHGEWGAEGVEMARGKDEVVALLANVVIYPNGTPRTRHVMSNIALDIDEDGGMAKGQCYITIFSQKDDGQSIEPIFSAHYFDEFQVIDGKWCFTKRLMRGLFIGDMSAHRSDM